MMATNEIWLTTEVNSVTWRSMSKDVNKPSLRAVVQKGTRYIYSTCRCVQGPLLYMCVLFSVTQMLFGRFYFDQLVAHFTVYMKSSSSPSSSSSFSSAVSCLDKDHLHLSPCRTSASHRLHSETCKNYSFWHAPSRDGTFLLAGFIALSLVLRQC